MDAKHRFEADPEAEAAMLSDTEGQEVERYTELAEDDPEEARPEPSSKLWNSRPDTERWLAQHHVGAADPVVSYRIQGWLAERGTSVWFGAGSTGKTQLMLWIDLPPMWRTRWVSRSCAARLVRA